MYVSVGGVCVGAGVGVGGGREIDKSQPGQSSRQCLVHLQFASTEFKAQLQPGLNCAFQISLKSTTKVLEHGGTSR